MTETKYKYLNNTEQIVNIDLLDLYAELTNAAANNKEVQINAAVLNTIASIKTNKYKEDSNLLCIQKFCNACLLEHLFIAENSNLKFRTDDHDIIVPNSHGIDVSDFMFTSKLFYYNKFKVELKIVAERPNQKMEHENIHDAEIIIYYHIFSKQYYTFIKNLETNIFLLCPGAIPELNYPKNFIFLKLIPDMQSNLVAVHTITHAVKNINFMNNQIYINLLSKVNPSRNDNLYSLENGYDQANGSNTDYGFDDSDYNEALVNDKYLGEAFGSANSNNLDISKALENKDYNNRYYNQLDLTKALDNKEECIEKIRDKYGYYEQPTTGGFYVMPDGTVIKSKDHANIDQYLIKLGYIPPTANFDYSDGSQFMEEINCLRLRARGGKDSWILPYVLLPKDRLTQAQYDVLTKWLDFVLMKNKVVNVQAEHAFNGVNKVFHVSDGIWTDDIIDAIKLYYRTNILEDFEYENPFDDEIDDTDYQLNYDVKKGYFDQF